MGDDQNGAGIFAQMVFQPMHGFRVEMVGRLVEQQEVGLRQEKLRQRHSPPFSPRQFGHFPIARRAAQRVHRLLHLRIQIPQVLRVDHVLQFRRFLLRVVGVVHHEFVVAVDHRLFRRDAFHDVAHHVLLGIKLRFLAEKTDAGAVRRPRLAHELLVHPGHDPQKRRFARAVRPENTDLGVRVEGQIDVFENLFAVRIGL